ncbi:PspA/IM30 family protein [Microscilla marina]|uniref:Phage shock protein A n=1 Tax=Microscilla marina ATCC 23134 TaxID=313606 RepID=A1ZJ30_MICM2|nr:PspA/IM30 family protein [Microscilla marina]EAY29566.1 phage shock protein A [Microscilla marina ATCC 23134]
MGIFKRIKDIVKSNVNDRLDKIEEKNPEKMIKQVVTDMQKAVAQATSALATAMSQERKMEHEYKKNASAAKNWEHKAMQALQAGNEDVARQCLSKKSEAETQANQYKTMFERSQADTVKLREQVQDLKTKLQDAKNKESMLIARGKAAQARTKMAKELGNGVDAESALGKFDKYEEKIMKAEAEAEAYESLGSADKALDDEIKQISTDNNVDDDLAKLRAKINNQGTDQ